MLRNDVTGRTLFVLIFSFVFINPLFAQSNAEDITVLLEESFEFGMNGWSAGNGVWEAGVPTSGPSSVEHGEQVAATILDGDYPSTAFSRLISPSWVLPMPAEGASLRLHVSHWYSLSSEDVGTLEISVEEGPWVPLSEVTIAGISSGWQELVLSELDAYAEMDIRIGFLFNSQDASTSSGWYIDRIQITEVKNTAERYESFEGNVIGWDIDGGQWEFGPPSNGPASAVKGIAVAGTVLDGAYADSDTTRLTSPPIQIPDDVDATNERFKLRFWHWFNLGEEDTASLSISENGGDFVLIESAFKGESRVWTRYVVPDLLDYASAGSEIRLAFDLNTTASGNNNAGWYIDVVETTIIDKNAVSTTTVTADKTMEGLPFDSTLTSAEWYADNGIWELGAPSPESGFSGSDSTIIAGTVLKGTYPNEAESRLISPPILIDTTSFSLDLTHSFSLSENDRAYVQIKIGDGEWTNIADPFTQAGGTGTEFLIGDVAKANPSLGNLEGETIRLGFLLVSQKDGPTSTGWYIESIGVGKPIPSVRVANEDIELPHSTVLHQNYPNPFNPTTTLSFELDRAVPVTLTVYDVLGRKVETLVDATLSSGPHAYTWNAQNASSGVYLYRLTTPTQTLTRQMMLFR